MRIRHLPTGIVAQATESRSQWENRAVDMKRLQALLERRNRKVKVRAEAMGSGFDNLTFKPIIKLSNPDPADSLLTPC